MGGTKKEKCAIEECDKPRKTYKGQIWSSYCTTHVSKATISGFLCKLYRDMYARVKGTKKGSVANRSRHLYVGKPILPKDIFTEWAKNHPDFLTLYKRYATNNFERRLAPSINRVNSKKGYTLDNMEWMTSAQNSGLSGAVIRMKNLDAIYKLVGVKK